jgi:hypothetical protein
MKSVELGSTLRHIRAKWRCMKRTLPTLQKIRCSETEFFQKTQFEVFVFLKKKRKPRILNQYLRQLLIVNYELNQWFKEFFRH